MVLAAAMGPPCADWTLPAPTHRGGRKKVCARGGSLEPPEGGGAGAYGTTRNTARQAMDGLWTEARGQQKQSNNPGNNQHILNTPIIGRR